MASDKQIQANRLNAQKSTGPQSPEGKQRVAHNRLKHGLAGEHVVLANEDKSAFDNLLATLNNNWDPHSETEAFLVETLAFNQWRLLRIGRMEQASLSRKHQSYGQLSLTMEVKISRATRAAPVAPTTALSTRSLNFRRPAKNSRQLLSPRRSPLSRARPEIL